MLNAETIRELRQAIGEVLPVVTDLRRHLHTHPELGTETCDTANAVRRALSCAELQSWEPLLGNDAIFDLSVPSDGRVCLRADMDALPIQEETGLPYASAASGKMHACGHDGHTAMLVGTALVLRKLKDRLPVSVRFVFQPGEETIAAGRELVSRGAVEGCCAAYALHSWPGLPVASVSTKEGVLFAAGAHFAITVKGKGCHGALPHLGTNPIPAAARIALGLQGEHERRNPVDGTVVSVCSFQAGSGSNVIPSEAVVRGTARYLDPSAGDGLEATVRGIARAAVEGGELALDIHYDRIYDLPLSNTCRAVHLVKTLAENHLGGGSWVPATSPSMVMEDFAFYIPGREGAMVLLGMGRDHPPLHTPTFDFDDSALETGIRILSMIALAGGACN